MKSVLLVSIMGLTIWGMTGFGIYSVAQEAENVKVEVRLIPDVQEEIQRIVDVLNSGAIKDQKDVSNLVDEFRAFEERPIDQLLSQVILAYGGRKEHFTDPNSEAAKRALLSFMIMDMPSDLLVNSVSPYNELAAGTSYKKNYSYVLAYVAFRDVGHEPNFSPFIEHLNKVKEKGTLPALVKYMLSVRPEKALKEVRKIYASKEANAVVLTPEELLSPSVYRSYSSRVQWWEELYIAEKMRQNPKLRDSEVIQLLKASKNKMTLLTVSEFESEANTDPSSSKK